MKRRIAFCAGLLSLGFAALAHAQVLEDTTFIDLPIIQSNAFNFQGVVSTHNVGEIDPSIVTNIGSVPLNDIAVLSQRGGNPLAQAFQNRLYVITHTSATDTRQLSAPTLVDITSENIDQNCFDQASSLQILDLTGDGVSDLAFAGENCFNPPVPITFAGSVNEGNIFGIQGVSGSPFFNNSNTILGQQAINAFMPDPVDSDISQPVLAAGDFNNNGKTDLAFYNFDSTGPSDLIQVLDNNGSFGILPTSANTITGPFNPAADLGFNVISGDFNGDGTQDIAMTFLNPTGGTGNQNHLVVYSGNGNGTFNGTPLLDQAFGDGGELHGLTAGDFDGNGFLDFALTETTFTASTTSQVYIFTCAPGSPNPTCNVNNFAVNPSAQNIGVSLATGDFNNDSLDDLAFSQIFEGTSPINTGSQVQIHLNNGGGFNAAPDQILDLNLLAGTDLFAIPQVVVKDIDGCGGPDLSFIGFGGQESAGITFSEVSTPLKQGMTPDLTNAQNQEVVAFNPNEAPVADAGPDDGVQVSGGIQIGGNPTCADPTNDVMEISWTQLSGNAATINNSTIANPIITDATGLGDAVFQVTCTEACGLSDTDTVTINLGALIQGSGSCSLQPVTSSGSLAFGGMMVFSAGILTLLRRRKMK